MHMGESHKTGTCVDLCVDLCIVGVEEASMNKQRSQVGQSTATTQPTILHTHPINWSINHGRIVLYVNKRRQEEQLIERARAHAKALDRSPSYVILNALDSYLTRVGQVQCNK